MLVMLLCVSDSPVGTGTTGPARDFAAKFGYGASWDDAGHLLGRQFGGSGNPRSMNIVPMQYSTNRGRPWYQAYEALAADLNSLLFEKDICFLCAPLYADFAINPNRPSDLLRITWTNY